MDPTGLSVTRLMPSDGPDKYPIDPHIIGAPSVNRALAHRGEGLWRLLLRVYQGLSQYNSGS